MLSQVTDLTRPATTPLPITWRCAAEDDSFTGRDEHQWTVKDVTTWRRAGTVVKAARDHDGKKFEASVDPDGPVVIDHPTEELDAIRLVQTELGGVVVHRGIAR